MAKEQLLSAKFEGQLEIGQPASLEVVTKGMDGQTVIHAVIILFILIGNIAYFRVRRTQARRSQS